MNSQDVLKELSIGFTRVAVGKEFLRLVAEHLSKALEVAYVFIGEITQTDSGNVLEDVALAKTVRPQVFFVNGQEAASVEYPLVGSLCEQVVATSFCAYPSQVQQQFPDNRALKHLGVDSYVGITLYAASGEVAGLLYVMDRGPIKDLSQTEYLLRIMAKRVELELERTLMERQLQEANQELQLQQAQRQKAEAELQKSNEELLRTQGLLKDLNQQLEQQIALRTEALESATRRITHLLEREKQARQEAEVQRKQVESLFMQAPVALAIFQGSEYKIELANSAMCNIWGKTREEVIGKPLFEALAEVKGQVFEGLLQKVYREGESLIGNEVAGHITRRGKRDQGYLNFVYQPIRDGGGEVTSIMAVANEVTEQVIARKQVEASEAKLQRILSTIPEVVFSFDEQLQQVQFLSPSAATLLEVPLAELHLDPQRLLSSLFPSQPEASRLLHTLSEQRHYTAEYRIFTDNGKEKWVATRLWLARETHPDNSSKVRIDGISSDITERKQAQFASQTREKRLSSLVESNTSFLIRTDLEGRYTFVNERFVNQFGLQREDLLGQLYFPTVHPEDIEICQQMAVDCIDHPGKVVPLELRKIIRGELYYTQWEFIGIADETGQVTEIQGVGFDITTRKQVDAERSQLIYDLSQKNQDLEQFTFIISHNLRAPVANILGLVDIFNRENMLDPLNLMVVENFGKAARRLDEVIQDLNELLSVRNRQQDRQEVLFDEVLGNVQLSLAQQIEKSEAEFIVDFSAAQSVYLVKSYVQSIVLNLVSNAIKYRSPDRPSVIKITSFQQGGYVVLSVADNGLGIDLDRHREKVFGLYRRFHIHTEGKGLGLHLVKTQTEAMGGKVEVVSKEGEGSEFRVYFLQSSNQTYGEANK